MGKMFLKYAEWASPEFACKNATEAKKIVQELKKMKKNLGKSRESQNITIQNNALLLDMKIDELIPVIESVIQSK